MATLDLTSPEYLEQSIGARQQAMAPAYRRALRSSRDDIASRGLNRGGVGMAATLETRGRFQDSLSNYGNQVGLQQYQVAERRKQAEDARAFQMAMQKAAYEFQREQQRVSEWNAEQKANKQYMASMFSSVGGMFGGAVGGQAGRSSDNRNRSSYPSYDDYAMGPPPDDASGIPGY